MGGALRSDPLRRGRRERGPVSGTAVLTVLLNGEPRELPAGATVEDVLSLLGAPRSGVAIAVNGDVLHRGEWSSPLVAGDRVEVLTATSGG